MEIPIVTEKRLPGRALVLLFCLHGLAAAQDTSLPVPTFAELEAAGARIGEIRVVPRAIFDTADPDEDKLLFRLANALHIRTRPDVIRRALLFKRGEPVSRRVLEETERLLRSNRHLYDVQFRPVAYHDGVVDIEVSTRDTWSLDPGVSAGRSGGANTTGIHLREYNLLGTGATVNFLHSRSVDRTGNEFQFSSDRVFGSSVSVDLSHAANSDGRRSAASIVQPFYALDSRWSAGITAAKDTRIDAVYNAGKVVGQYRHGQEHAEAFAGWSPGLAGGWVERYSVGLSYQNDTYASETDLAAPARLQSDEKQVAPFFRGALIEDRYARELNRNLIGRPEFFALGLASTVQLGWAGRRLGSSRDALVYALTISRGFEPMPDHTLIASAKLTGQYAGTQVRRQRLGAQAQYYLPQTPRWLFYASAAGDVLTRPDPVDSLLLGGDNGLRGYPLRYQSGTRRALFTVEERFYTDLYVWRLFRIGGAVFVDAGRAWGGNNLNAVSPGWLGNAGFGLRIVNSRTAFSNVLHIDVAFPSNANADVKKVQLLVKTRASF
ncbi:MAG: BamA/TamA family outer membrane protein [Burkholderiales bacterium]|nr:BamA/TamA family outer membrane protein [Burkholderiales bacterium]